MSNKDQPVLTVLGGYTAYKPKIIVDRRWPWTWVRRACHWILDKIGVEDSRVEIVEIRFDTVAELILEQQHAIEFVFRRHCRWVILGQEQWAKLNLETKGQVAFQFPPDYRYPRCSRPWAFAGMHVVIVPWFDGVLCLQELP